jgi:ornithine carbamoyltransferase
MTDLLSVANLTCQELEELLDHAAAMKRESQGFTGTLSGTSLGYVLHRPSAAERVVVETAAHRLGMLPVVLTPDELEAAQFTAALFASAPSHRELRGLAAAAPVPVVNAVSDDHHPCHAFADLLTLREQFGGLEGLALAYVGPVGNVAHSLMEAGALCAMDVRIACPQEHQPSWDVRFGAEVLADRHGARLTITGDARDAVAGADAVYTAPWSPRPAADSKVRWQRRRRLGAFQVDETLMHHAKERAVFMHALPAHPGEEVTPWVLNGPRSLVAQQTTNRLPAVQATIHAAVTARTRAWI